MPSFRTISPIVVPMPSVALDTSNSLAELASIFGKGLQNATSVVNTLASDQADQNRKDAATAAVELYQTENSNAQKIKENQLLASIDQDKAQIAHHEYERNLFVQRQGIPGLLASTPPDQLGGLLSAHPELLPEVQNLISEDVGRRFAREDASGIAARVAADPGGTKIDELTSKLKQSRLQSITDPKTQAEYSLALDSAQADISSAALISQAKGDAQRAADGAFGAFADDTAKALYVNGLTPEMFDAKFDELQARVQRFMPNASAEDVRQKAFVMFAHVAGKNALGMDLSSLQPQVDALASRLGTKYPELAGIATALKSEAAQMRIAQSHASEQEDENILKNAPDKSILELGWSGVQDRAKKGLYTQGQVLKLKEAYTDRTGKLNALDDVTTFLGSNALDSADNVALALGPQHYEAIDTYANRLDTAARKQGGRFLGPARAAWMVKNFGYVTPKELDALRVQASESDPAHFLAAFSEFKSIYDANPVYAQSLADGKTLPAKFQAAVSMSVLGGEDLGLVAKQLASVSDEDIIDARKLFTATAHAGDSSTVGDLKLKDFWMIGRKLDAGNIYNAKVQKMYLDAASLYAASIRKTQGVTDPKQLASTADVLATQFIQRNVTTIDLADEKYLLPRAMTQSIGFDKGQWQNVSALWSKQRRDVAEQLGVSRSELAPDLSNSRKEGDELVIPITLRGLEGFALDSAPPVTFMRIPLDRIKLKQATETVRIPATAPTQEQLDAINKYGSQKGFGG